MPALDLPDIAQSTLLRRASGDFVTSTTPANNINLGGGGRSANDFNNALFLGLFASIAGLMVLVSFWFFFFAKNGGFHWKKGDWDDYKSTVLRRKGPDGKTLSNATKSTRLGGGSEAPSFDDRGARTVAPSDWDGRTDKEMREAKKSGGLLASVAGARREKGERQSSRHDPELAAYKHEKAAKVGGINSRPAGSHYDYTNTDPSVFSSTAPAPGPQFSAKAAKKAAKEAEKQQKQRQKEAIKAEKLARKMQGKNPAKNAAQGATMQQVPAAAVNDKKPQQQQRGHPSAAYSFVSGDDTNSIYTSTNTYSDYTSMTAPRTAAAPSESARSYYYDNHYRPSAPLGPISEVSSAQSSQHHHRNRPSANLPSSPVIAAQQEQQTPLIADRYRRQGRQTAPSHDDNRHRGAHQQSPTSSPRHGSPARNSPSAPRQATSSPRKTYRSGQYTPVHHQSGSNDLRGSYSQSTISDDSGTKVYPCYIPGVSGPRAHGVREEQISPNDSVSQVGGRMQQERRGPPAGYRRGRNGGAKSRDELSEEEDY